MKIDLSIIIVSFNTKDLLLACLTSLKQARRESDRWEIIVVDNASTDGSVISLKQLIKNDKFFKNSLLLIESKINLGFAGGNNLGIKKAQGKYVLLLNSDTEIIDQAIQKMLDFMESHPRAGLATGKLLLSDNFIDPACHRGFPMPWAALTYFLGLEKLFPTSELFSQYHLGFKNLNEPHEIDSPSGAFFLVRREVIEQVGMLDEDYFMYGEDLDWAYRIKQAGWQVWYNPRAEILHRKKQSGRASIDGHLRKRTQKYFYETMQIFYKKHYQNKYPKILTWTVALLLKIRIAII